MSLWLVGENIGQRRADFLAVAALAGLRAGDANQVIDAMLADFAVALDRLTVPPKIFGQANAESIVANVLSTCRQRLGAFG